VTIVGDAGQIVGQCTKCGKDVPKFALDEGKCAFCDASLAKCETCGGYLFADNTIHSLEPGKCGPRPIEAEGEDSALDASEYSSDHETKALRVDDPTEADEEGR
jgi:hypothetical protein